MDSAAMLTMLVGGDSTKRSRLARLRQSLNPARACCGAEGGRILRVTLVRADSVPPRLDFYLEAWCEPAEGYPKHSVVHRRPGRSEVDLRCEQLELDWVGDETEVVIQAVHYSGSKQSRDLPVGEIRIPASSIQRYAHEASCHEDEVHYGTRVFQMAPLEHEAALSRKVRFQDMLPKGIANALVKKIGEEIGLHVPSAEEMRRLKEENARLRNANETLRSQTGLSDVYETSQQQETHMNVTVRFEIISPRSSHELDLQLPIRKASFQ
mmetsp:Transcript_90051/g.232417  ORF Transcript_90051/g.232417 Transcript_90051/m.232417 type:complete len:267 (-) Transcript_90051:117-917(-)